MLALAIAAAPSVAVADRQSNPHIRPRAPKVRSRMQDGWSVIARRGFQFVDHARRSLPPAARTNGRPANPGQ